MNNLFDDMDWVDIPENELRMGTPEAALPALMQRLAGLPVEPSWFLKECPQRTVRVGGFAIARTPLTGEQFARLALVLGLPEIAGVGSTGSPDHPVAVTYAVADLLVTHLAAATGAPVHLPDEAQWESAARGDDGREYPWGVEFSPERANIGEGSRGGTSPVGAYPDGASPFGVLDLAGNLDEWTCSVYEPYPGASAAVPLIEEGALDPHVTRGGGWNHQRDAGRCARRHGLYDDGPVGIRLALG